MSRIRLFLEWFAILACSLAIAWWAGSSGATARLDNALLDRIATVSAKPASDGILIVAIDDRSLADVGRWPWDRGFIARLVDRIAASGPRAILLDVLFTEPSTPSADKALADSLARFPKVALPYGLAQAENRTEGMDAVKPIPLLRDRALVTGHVAVSPDSDGVIRRLPVEIVDPGGQRFHHVVSELHRRLEDSQRFPEIEAGLDPIMHLRPAGAYRTVPAAAALKGEVPPEFVRGKLVIVGASAPGLGDLFPVSSVAGSTMSGAELQANLYQDIGEAGFIKAASPGISLAVACVVLVLLFLGFWQLRPVWCLTLAMALAILVTSLSFILARASFIWIAPGPVLLALVVAYPLWGWRRLAAVSQFLDREAAKLEPEVSDPGEKKSSLTGFDAVARQISRLDFLVDEVSARRTFLRRVIEATPDALCAFDSEERLILMNERALALFGPDMEGKPLPELVASVHGRMNAQGNELQLEDGRIFAVAHSIGQSKTPFEKIGIAVLTDITAKRKREQERQQMLEFLSHDMRSPQVAILGLAGQKAHDLEEASRFLRIRNHARRTLELADNFVQLARLAEVPLEIEELDAGMLVAEAIDRAHAAARDRQAVLKMTLPDEPVFVRCDGQVISRVLDNLVGNAIKYGRDAGTVSVELSHRTDRNDPLDMAVITLVDDGPGLPEARRNDPFHRFGAHGKGGTGLGLAFVGEAITRHKGVITCESSPQTGTRFTIGLPALPAFSDE